MDFKTVVFLAVKVIHLKIIQCIHQSNFFFNPACTMLNDDFKKRTERTKTKSKPLNWSQSLSLQTKICPCDDPPMAAIGHVQGGPKFKHSPSAHVIKISAKLA